MLHTGRASILCGEPGTASAALWCRKSWERRVCTVPDTPGSRRHVLHPVGLPLNLEGVAEGEGRGGGRLWGSQRREMCQPLKERGDEREKKSGEQSRDVKQRWGGERGDDGAKIRWGTGTGRADLVLSPRTKFPLEPLPNLAWGGGRTGGRMEKQGKGGCRCRPAAPQAAQRGFPWPQGGAALLPTATVSPPSPSRASPSAWDTPPSAFL